MAFDVIRGKIAEQGKSQKEIARQLNMSAQSFSRKMTGKRQFTVNEATRLCDLLSVLLEERGKIFFCQSSQISNHKQN